MKSILAGILAAVLALSLQPAYAQTDFELLGSRIYTDSAGNHHIVGEIKNTTIRTWRFVEVTVPLIDEDERVIAAPTAFLFVEYLRPGESGAFHILTANSTQFDAAVEYAVHVNYLVTDPPEGLLEATLSNVTAGSGGVVRMAGEVKNLGNTTATEVQVSAALYDADNNLIDTTVGFSDDIAPGDRTSFSLVSGVQGTDEADRISINVQSREYVMVPEFLVPTLALLAGLASVVMLARRYGNRSIFQPSS